MRLRLPAHKHASAYCMLYEGKICVSATCYDSEGSFFLLPAVLEARIPMPAMRWSGWQEPDTDANCCRGSGAFPYMATRQGNNDRPASIAASLQ